MNVNNDTGKVFNMGTLQEDSHVFGTFRKKKEKRKLDIDVECTEHEVNGIEDTVTVRSSEKESHSVFL